MFFLEDSLDNACSMILSLLVYTITGCLFFLFGRNIYARELSLPNGQSIPFLSFEIVVSILLFAFVSGGRYNVGVDHLSYWDVYQSFRDGRELSRDTYELGFLWITKLIAATGLHPFFYFAFFGGVQLGVMYYACRDRKYLLPYMGLFVMLGPFFLTWMNGIRQSLAACCFVFLVSYIKDRHFGRYVIGIFILSLMHKSALILLPLYFLGACVRFVDKRYLNISLLILSFFLGMMPTWLTVIASFSDLLAMLGYNYYAVNIDMMVADGYSSTAFGPSRLMDLIITCFLFWYYPNLKCFFGGDKYLPIYFLFFMIGSCLYNLFVNTDHIFLRPIMYLTIFKLPLCAYLLFYLKKSSQKWSFWVLFVCAFSYIYFVIYKSVFLPSTFSDTNLYRFCFGIN